MTLSDSACGQVADQLRARIHAGQLPPGSKLPGENELIKYYGVSRMSARGALKILSQEGLVRTLQGKGSFVRRIGRPNHTEPRGVRRSMDTYADISMARGMVLVAEPTRRRCEASIDLAVDLDLPMQAQLFTYHRLLTDATGWRLAHSLYLPLATCADVAELDVDPHREPDDLYAILADAGYSLRWVETVTARTPSPDQAASLHIPQGIPMLIVRRFTQDARTGRRLAMEEVRLATDDAQLRYEL